MRNKQIQNLALVLADLSDIGHISSTMSFVNKSGNNYVNVKVGESTFTIKDNDIVEMTVPPTEMSFSKFLKELISVTDKHSAYGN